MWRPSAQFTSAIGSCRQRGAWYHALLASAWGVPETLTAVAQKCHGLVPVLLRAKDIDSRTNGIRNKLHEQPAPLSVDTHTAFLRRGRTAGNPSDATRGTAENGELQTDVMGTTCTSNNHALDAFQCWSKRTGGCTANEFINGVQQSYYGLGVVLGTLAEASKAQMPVGKTVPLSAALAQLRVLLTKHYGVIPRSLFVENEASDENSEKGVKRNAAKAVVQALKQVLPISTSLAESIYHIWNKQRMLEANLFCVAGPTDYILSTEMILFHECCSNDKVHLAGDTPLTMTRVPPVPSVGHDATRGVATSANEQLESKSEKKQTAEVEETKTEAVAVASAVLSDDGDNNKEAGQIIISYKGRPLPPIPASAIACAVATIDVVTPPQRYALAFDWFYQRITGHESEYERIAAARIFAMSNARPIVAPLDFLMRMFTGRHVEFMCANGVSELIGIPKNIRECPPATRKLLCFYMDSNKRWVLADLLAVDNVLATMVPKTSPS